jgi:formate hydrogenlyase subunit 6/NADH:ubiquinone oxidoreductase subunit I
MAEKILDKNELDSFLEKLEQAHEVYAPMRREDGSAAWGRVGRAEELTWTFTNTELSPKSFFEPETECLMDFRNDPKDPEGMIMKPAPGLQRKRALLNIRPCDAKALVVNDHVFCADEESTDVYWKDKRDKTVLIGLACHTPCPTCFCTSVNCGPHHEEGLDVLLRDLGEKLVAKPLSERGEELLSGLPEASEQDAEAARAQKEKAEASMQSSVGMDKVLARDIMELYEREMWDRISDTCINCGTCTYVCPTCYCFDIQDEVQGDYGRRVRNWDSCMSWLFTYHTSGHNPRGRKRDRVRQRFMHKFKYQPFKMDLIGCVGCGRCSSKCPTDIDVREVVNTMNA